MDLTNNKLYQALANFLDTLPPLLQLLLGVFVVLGFLKIFMVTVDYIEDKREGKR